MQSIKTIHSWLKHIAFVCTYASQEYGLWVIGTVFGMASLAVCFTEDDKLLASAAAATLCQVCCMPKLQRLLTDVHVSMAYC